MVDSEERASPGEHPHVLRNETPGIVSNSLNIVIFYLQNYGWFLILGTVALIFLRSKLQPYFEDWRQRRQEQQEYARYKQNPDLVRRQQDAMEQARRKLQEQHDAQAATFAEQEKLKEERKRQERLEDWDRHQEGKGYRSKIKSQENQASSSTSSQKPKPPKKNVYRTQDYNPLTGSGGGGAGFRPTRSPRGGGG